MLLVAAGVLAGAAGSAGGITSLISYPALLAAGIPPLPANVTQAVAFVTCLPGSALGSLKNVLLGVSDVVAAVGLALFGRFAGRRRCRWPWDCWPGA